MWKRAKKGGKERKEREALSLHGVMVVDWHQLVCVMKDG